MAAELREQVPVMKEMLQAMGIVIVEQAGYEADDLLGTIAKRAQSQGLQVSIVSGDRDLLQLVSDQIKVRIPKTKKTGTEVEDYLTPQVLEKYHVTPKEFIDVKALMGDTSDNVPGVPGIGEKTATKIISQYGSIENAYAHIDEMPKTKVREAFRENYEKACFSKKLVTIDIDADITYDLSQAKLGSLYTKEAYVLCQKLELKSLLARFAAHNDTLQEGTATNDAASHLEQVTDLAKAEAVFAKIRQAEKSAVQFIAQDGVISGIAAALSKEELYFIRSEGLLTPAYLADQYAQLLCSGNQIAMFHLKESLRFVEIKPQLQLFDVALAAYLLNPLKSEYTYESVAKDYLGELLPSRADLLGKLSYEDALVQKPEACSKVISYQVCQI